MPPLPPIPGSIGPGVIRGPAARLGAAFGGGALGVGFFAGALAELFTGFFIFLYLSHFIMVAAYSLPVIFLLGHRCQGDAGHPFSQLRSPSHRAR